MSSSPAVGFIGLGNIGQPMALRLVDWPGGLVVFDTLTANTDRCVKKGATLAASAADLAASCSVIFTMVRDEEQVRSVMSGPNGILATARAGTVLVVHSTIDVGAPARLAELARPHGVEVIDAPVSGGQMGAASGQLAIMVGGSDHAFETARPALEMIASLVSHVGPLGAGTACKLARNLITFASFAAAGEATRLAEAMGIDVALLGEVVRHSDAVTGGVGSIMIRDTAAPMADDDGLKPIFEHAYQLGHKDLELAVAMAQEAGVDLPVATLALDHLAAAFGLAK